ncbi:hypothetical protein [Thermomonospora umbrina]|uniref:hypothetical protein n=1 Tax=Thermomonospora umbrina TaxID=111806 RepID=UPI0011C10F73|nr:hypothetical protein [Thermomonospora umbrina]
MFDERIPELCVIGIAVQDPPLLVVTESDELDGLAALRNTPDPASGGEPRTQKDFEAARESAGPRTVDEPHEGIREAFDISPT